MLYPGLSLGKLDRLRLFQFLWNDPNLLGVIDDPTKFGETWQSQDAIETTSAKHYYGCIRLPGPALRKTPRSRKVDKCGTVFEKSSSLRDGGLRKRKMVLITRLSSWSPW